MDQQHGNVRVTYEYTFMDTNQFDQVGPQVPCLCPDWFKNDPDVSL
jgi:hypothetical protein